MKPGDRLFYFTTCGWMMWNWLASGLASGATLVLYDGSPFHPTPAALFDLAAEERVTIFGTSAKFLDSAAKAGLAPRRTHDLSALRTVLSTGSPLLPEGFDYVYREVKEDVHLASISGGTDIISCFVLGNPTAPVYRGEIQCAGLGMAVEVFDEDGSRCSGGRASWSARARSRRCRSASGATPTAPAIAPPTSSASPASGITATGRWRPSAAGSSSTAAATPSSTPAACASAPPRSTGRSSGSTRWSRVDRDRAGLGAATCASSCSCAARRASTLDDELRSADQSARSASNAIAAPRAGAGSSQVADIPRTRSGKITELAVRDVVHGATVKNVGALANPEALAHFRNRPELAA